jgi:UDP-N-acetylmuramoyl-L-alanyl-D-glutamate--2,6-diaminopimelate ligase
VADGEIHPSAIHGAPPSGGERCPRWDAAWRVSGVAVEDLKAKLGALADHVYGRPSHALYVVGVTGQRQDVGTHWIAQMPRRLRPEGGILGTLGNGFPARSMLRRAATRRGQVHEARPTARCRRSAVAMVPSTASRRTQRAVEFDQRCSRASAHHLDYHGTMEAYAAAKAVSSRGPARACVINADAPSAHARRRGGRAGGAC